MRRILTVLLALMLCGQVFASTLSVKSRNEIADLSSLVQAMTPEDASSFISMKMKGSVAPCAVNLTVGFGIGSFMQGDWKGGLIALLGDLAGGALVATGATKTLQIEWSLTNTGRFFVKDPTQMNDLKTSLTLTGIGASVLIASRVFSAMRTQSYAKQFNAALFSSAWGTPELPETAAIREEETGIRLPDEITSEDTGETDEILQ